jgi:hypothetical protein
MFTHKPGPAKYMSGVQNNTKSSLSQEVHADRPKSSSSSFNPATFTGVINTAQLCVHEEQADGAEDEAGAGSGDDDEDEEENSFTGTRQHQRRLGNPINEHADSSSSPCAGPLVGSTGSPGMLGGSPLGMLAMGDSPCALASKPKVANLFSRPNLFLGNAGRSKSTNNTLKPTRTLQRASTSTGYSMFG